MPELILDSPAGPDPEHEALIADSVGLALLFVLETLNPAERLAFVLHDMFGVPFDEIARIVDRSPETARQLASRARRRVRASNAEPDVDLGAQREVVEAFLAAAREGDFARLLAVLDPDVVVRRGLRPGRARPPSARSAARRRSRARRSCTRGSRLEMHPVLVNGAIGFVSHAQWRALLAGRFTIRGGRIVEMDFLADPARLRRLDLTVLLS